MICAAGGRSRSYSIALVNIFLGWTVLGWFWALILSCMNPPPQNLIVIAQNFQEQPRARDWERGLLPRLPPLRLPAQLLLSGCAMAR
ncbi:superinfection immunity protein [Nitrospira sp. Nam80]